MMQSAKPFLHLSHEQRNVVDFIVGASYLVHEYFELTEIGANVGADLIGERLFNRRRDLADAVRNNTFLYRMATEYAEGYWKLGDRLWSSST